MTPFKLITAFFTLAQSVNALAASGGDADAGRLLYESRCIACHSVDENRVGPAHRGVYGRKAGLAADYDYSPALKKSKIIWTEPTLDRWLQNPERLVAGQKMGYSVMNLQDRLDLIAYLKTLSR
jgi:cytochrome c